MRSAIRTAVVGCGYFGRQHIKKFEVRSDLIVYCDKDYRHLNIPGGLLNIQRYTDYQEVSDIDAVSIVTPATTHYEIAKHFLEKGVHCLVEKPLAVEVEQAEELAKIAEKKGLILAVGFLERFSTTNRWLKTVVERPFQMRCRRIRPYNERGRDVSVILDLMSHDIDLALTLDPTGIQTILTTGDYDKAWAEIHFETGTSVYLEADRTGEIAERSVLIETENAEFSLKFPQEDLLDREIRAFISACELGKPSIPQRSIDVLRVAREMKVFDKSPG